MRERILDRRIYPNLLRYQSEFGPDRDVQRRFHAGVSAGKLKGPVNPNGSRMYRGQNSAVHKIPTTGNIHNSFVKCTETALALVMLLKVFASQTCFLTGVGPGGRWEKGDMV